MTDRQKLAAGLTAIAIGIITVIAASLFVHAAESPTTDIVGNELWPLVPRGWVPATIGQLVAIGVAALISFHVFVNVGMTIRLMPVTGLPLPFMSAGGTVFVAMSVALRLVNSVWLHRAPARGEGAVD